GLLCLAGAALSVRRSDPATSGFLAALAVAGAVTAPWYCYHVEDSASYFRDFWVAGAYDDRSPPGAGALLVLSASRDLLLPPALLLALPWGLRAAWRSETGRW